MRCTRSLPARVEEGALHSVFQKGKSHLVFFRPVFTRHMRLPLPYSGFPKAPSSTTSTFRFPSISRLEWKSQPTTPSATDIFSPRDEEMYPFMFDWGYCCLLRPRPATWQSHPFEPTPRKPRHRYDHVQSVITVDSSPSTTPRII